MLGVEVTAVEVDSIGVLAELDTVIVCVAVQVLLVPRRTAVTVNVNTPSAASLYRKFLFAVPVVEVSSSEATVVALEQEQNLGSSIGRRHD